MKLYSQHPNEVRQLMYPSLENENSDTKVTQNVESLDKTDQETTVVSDDMQQRSFGSSLEMRSLCVGQH